MQPAKPLADVQQRVREKMTLNVSLNMTLKMSLISQKLTSGNAGFWVESSRADATPGRLRQFGRSV